MQRIEKRTWYIKGLPGSMNKAQQTYRFEIGPLAYLPPYDERTIYLHIPEIPNRDAEGRPRHPEQAAWIREILQNREIKAKEVWPSHWRFSTPQEAKLFEDILKEFGAHLEEETGV